jgi:hypothetical protein
MTTIYKLLKPMPGHEVGDFVVLNDFDIYTFETEPKYKLDQEQVEKNPDWFEKNIIGWERNQLIYFIDVLGNIVEDNFNPERHSTLISKNRIFSSKKDAENMLNLTEELISGNSILISKDDINEILSQRDIKSIKKLLNKHI